MQNPHYYKYELPIFVHKPDSKIRTDKYEHYYPTVLRNLLIHCGDHLWKAYPFRACLDEIIENIPPKARNILEIGCGVGRSIAEIAIKFPALECYGIDYSLQMLKCAHKIWVLGDGMEVDGRDKGFSPYKSPSEKLTNLKFAMTSAEFLPWEENEIDVVFASFLLDRIGDVELTLREVFRVLSPSGTFIIVTPFNMEKRDQWQKYYPEEAFIQHLNEAGFHVIDEQKFVIREPIDSHGNSIHWNCTSFVTQKT